MHRFLLLAVLAVVAAETFATEAQTVREGDRVTLKGTFSIETGSDNHERIVRYQAVKLNVPIDIEFEDGRETNVQRLKLWLHAMPRDTFSKYRGKQLIVSGRVHYFSMGPSTFPNPAKLEVFAVKPVAVTVRPNPSFRGALRDEAAHRP